MSSSSPSQPLLPARGHVPQLHIATSLPEHCDSLIIATFTGDTGVELAGHTSLPETVNTELWKSLTSVGAHGSFGEVVEFPAPSSLPADTIVAIGLGKEDKLSAETIRYAAGTASRKVNKHAHSVSTLGQFDLEAATQGHALGAYLYEGLKSTDEKDIADTHVTLIVDSTEESSEVFVHACAVTEAVVLARDLVNTPANYLYPEVYAEFMKATAEPLGIGVEILNENDLEEQGFGGIIGVGRGSARPPRLVRLEWKPDPLEESRTCPHIALVGKGITFDTGGISLKPGANMDHMISDMGGSAAVFATIIAAAELDFPVRITATIPIAENMPGSQATRPGDVLRHYGGTTTEVLNTDAEGRLILADAIARAVEDKPDYLIETATLTGAQIVALGERTPGVMGSDEFRDAVAQISQDIGEGAWAMPLPEELNKALDSSVADIRNISGSRFGGMLVAGHYLSRFIPDHLPWVHIDVAGPAFNSSSPYGYTPARGTGVPVRTIIATLESLTDQSSAQ